MTVNLILSKTLGGSAVADSLAGGGSGFQFGTSEVGLTAPTHEIYIRHDGSIEIENLEVYVRAYTQTYGGEYSASADYTKILAQGAASSGFQMDFDYDGTAFAVYTTVTSSVASTPLNSVVIPATAIFRNNSGTPASVSGAIAGAIGASGDTTLGDVALIKARWMVPLGESDPGRRQVDLAFTYNYAS